MNQFTPQPESIARQDTLAPCSIAIKCADDLKLFNCIDSIDDDVAINIVCTPSDRIEGMLKDRDIPFSVTAYGNIAKSAEISVREAEHDTVIVMDSDSWFYPNTIRALREALRHNPIAKPSIQFQTDSHISRLIAKKRRPFYDRPNYAANPGLALKRNEIRDACGGYVFDARIRWTEDADLQYRLTKAGIDVTYVPEAAIGHGPVSLKHELRTALLYGAGKRMSVEQNPERFAQEEVSEVTQALRRSAKPNQLRAMVHEQGIELFALNVAWQGLYLSGYHIQKQTGHWSPSTADVGPTAD